MSENDRAPEAGQEMRTCDSCGSVEPKKKMLGINNRTWICTTCITGTNAVDHVFADVMQPARAIIADRATRKGSHEGGANG